jgi:putative Holliday junction resolvase
MSWPNKGVILSLDIGSKRTGIALTDTNQTVAFLRDEIEHKSNQELFKKIQIFCKENSVTALLVGYPTSMEGTQTKQSHDTLKSVEKLKELKLPIKLIDERLSTFQAHKIKQHKGKHVDSESAYILLQTHLDSKDKS